MFLAKSWGIKEIPISDHIRGWDKEGLINPSKTVKLYSILCAYLLSHVRFFATAWTSLPGSSVHEDSPGKNTGVGCHALIHGFFPTQGSNWGLLHCRWIIYQLSHQGSPQYSLPKYKYDWFFFNWLANKTL